MHSSRTVRCSCRQGEGGVSRRVCVSRGGMCRGEGGVCLGVSRVCVRVQGVCVHVCVQGVYTPSSVDRILDTRLWKHYLSATIAAEGNNRTLECGRAWDKYGILLICSVAYQSINYRSNCDLLSSRFCHLNGQSQISTVQSVGSIVARIPTKGHG